MRFLKKRCEPLSGERSPLRTVQLAAPRSPLHLGNGTKATDDGGSQNDDSRFGRICFDCKEMEALW